MSTQTNNPTVVSTQESVLIMARNKCTEGYILVGNTTIFARSRGDLCRLDTRATLNIKQLLRGSEKIKSAVCVAVRRREIIQDAQTAFQVYEAHGNCSLNTQIDALNSIVVVNFNNLGVRGLKTAKTVKGMSVTTLALLFDIVLCDLQGNERRFMVYVSDQRSFYYTTDKKVIPKNGEKVESVNVKVSIAEYQGRSLVPPSNQDDSLNKKPKKLRGARISSYIHAMAMYQPKGEHVDAVADDVSAANLLLTIVQQE